MSFSSVWGEKFFFKQILADKKRVRAGEVVSNQSIVSTHINAISSNFRETPKQSSPLHTWVALYAMQYCRGGANLALYSITTTRGGAIQTDVT